MFSRRCFMQSSIAAAALLVPRVPAARAESAPGVTDTEIKIGQTIPYSGPASAYGVIGRTEAAYFKMINDQGGINGRKINFISLDDGYSPPKTVEQVRRLGSNRMSPLFVPDTRHPVQPSNPAILQRQQDAAIFLATGATTFSDPQRFSWTIRGL